MKNSRLVFIGIAIIVALLLIGGGVWFWSIGSVEAEKLPSIRVQVDQGSVSYKASGSDNWQTIDSVMEIHSGDSVKTATSSEAEIIWGDLGVTRLDENAEVIVTDAPAEASGEDSVIGLKVSAGRVWSRMLKLLDVDSSMQVQTSDVVATVRGTSFGVIKTPSGTEAAVSESVVSVASLAGGDETLVADNEWGAFGGDGKPRIVRKLTDADAWPAAQRQKDAQFDRDYLSALRARVLKRIEKKSNVPEWVLNASERVHLAMSIGDGKKELALEYARRHLARSISDPSSAAAELAKAKARIAAAGDKSSALRSELHAASTLFNRTRLSPATVQALRGLRDALGKGDASNVEYRGLVHIDEAIDDYLNDNLDGGNKAQAASALINRIEQAEQEIKDKNVNDTRLTEKTKALRKRLADALGIAPQDLPKPEEPVLVPGAVKPSVRSVNDPTLNPPVIKQAPTSRTYLRIQLLPSPSSVAVGSPVALKLFGVKADGQADDLSSQTTFSVSAGTLSGSILTPTAVGSITASGSFTDSEGTRTASASVTVTKPTAASGAILKSLAVVLTGTNTVACGSAFPFKVMGTYSDGTTKDVTIMSSNTSSDPKMLYVGQGTAASSCPSDQQITVSIMSSVTDKSGTQTASTDIIIMRDPNGTKSCPAYLARYGGC